jgi:5'(3')-deoxyribonucleotidase
MSVLVGTIRPDSTINLPFMATSDDLRLLVEFCSIQKLRHSQTQLKQVYANIYCDLSSIVHIQTVENLQRQDWFIDSYNLTEESVLTLCKLADYVEADLLVDILCDWLATRLQAYIIYVPSWETKCTIDV